jgi:hypothetical protein
MTVIIAFFLSRAKDFKAFYFGASAPLLQAVFPKLTCHSAILRRLPLGEKILPEFLQSGPEKGFFIVDSTPFSLCKSIRVYSRRLFPEFAGWAHSATKCIFGFKLHIVVNERGKIIAFRLTNGKRHDVRETGALLRGLTGTEIGDKGHCPMPLRKRLAKSGMRFIAHACRNMGNGNTPEEKMLLRRRNLVERVIGKLKRHIGDCFSRFRARGAVQTTIASGILTLNPCL